MSTLHRHHAGSKRGGKPWMHHVLWWVVGLLVLTLAALLLWTACRSSDSKDRQAALPRRPGVHPLLDKQDDDRKVDGMRDSVRTEMTMTDDEVRLGAFADVARSYEPRGRKDAAADKKDGGKAVGDSREIESARRRLSAEQVWRINARKQTVRYCD